MRRFQGKQTTDHGWKLECLERLRTSSKELATKQPTIYGAPVVGSDGFRIAKRQLRKGSFSTWPRASGRCLTVGFGSALSALLTAKQGQSRFPSRRQGQTGNGISGTDPAAAGSAWRVQAKKARSRGKCWGYHDIGNKRTRYNRLQIDVLIHDAKTRYWPLYALYDGRFTRCTMAASTSNEGCSDLARVAQETRSLSGH